MSENKSTSEEQVRKRAYDLWEQAGRPEGRDDDFWNQAEMETESLIKYHAGISPVKSKTKPSSTKK